jgi:uncharacterized membrane protein (DUF485 family)
VRDRLGPLAGTLTSAAVMLSPHLINQSSKLRPEILTMVLVTLAMPALLRQRRTLRDLLLAAFWLAAACHIRNSVLPFAATVGLWLFLLEPISRFTRRGFRNAAVFSATFLLLLVPWCSFASARVGKPVLIAYNAQYAMRSGTLRNELIAPRRGLAHEKQEDPFAERDEAPERRPPSTMGGLLLHRIRSFVPLWSPLPFSAYTSRTSWLILQLPLWLTTPGFLLAILFSRGFLRSRLVGACGFTVLMTTVVVTFIYVRVRYRYPFDPLIYATAVWGWWHLLGLRSRSDPGAPESET